MYKLTVSKEQLKVIEKALDFYSRIGCGQLEEAALPEFLSYVSPEDLGILRQVLYDLKPFACGLNSGHYGPLHETINEKFKIAYDMHKLFRHHLAWEENPKGGIEVCYDNPYLLHTSKQPFAKITKEEDNE